MSTPSVEAATHSNAELDALLNDVQHLLQAFNAAKAENKQLKARIADQDQLMEKAHLRLMSMLKRLPTT